MRLIEKYALPFLDADSYAPLLARAGACRDTLISGGGPGSEFTGWLSLADGSDPAELERIESTAAKIRDTAELLVVVGIGGPRSNFCPQRLARRKSCSPATA